MSICKISPMNFNKVEKYISSPQKVLLAFVSQFIWDNEYIKIENNTIYYSYFLKKTPLNHIGDLFENNDKMRS